MNEPTDGFSCDCGAGWLVGTRNWSVHLYLNDAHAEIDRLRAQIAAVEATLGRYHKDANWLRTEIRSALSARAGVSGPATTPAERSDPFICADLGHEWPPNLGACTHPDHLDGPASISGVSGQDQPHDVQS